MFNTNTTFILGAGASWHYGYPTGEELVRRVIKKAQELETYCEQSSHLRNPFMPKYLLRNGRGEPGQEGGLWAAAAYSARQLFGRLTQVNPTVIDYFLKQNADLHEIGKLAIAMVLFDCEAAYDAARGNPNRIELTERLKRQGRFPQGVTVQPSAFDDDWLRFVLYKITSSCRQSSDLLNNKLTFATFNYDTSLEQRLFLGLNNIKYFSKEDVLRFLGHGRILHVYGKLREEVENVNPMSMYLPPSVNAREPQELQNVQLRFDAAYDASLGIRTIDGPEKIEDSETLKAVSEAIADSRSLYVLGYGFDEANSARIGLNFYKSQSPANRSVFFTNFGGHNRVSMAASRLLFDSYSEFLPPNPPVRSDTRYLGQNAYRYRWEMSTKNVYEALSEDFESLETD